VNRDRYLLDAVTLSRLRPDQRVSTFVRTNGRIPSEVMYEAQGLPEIKQLAELEYKPNLAVLENIKVVMATLEPGDNLVDLYRNEGGGDVMLLASALTLLADDHPNLFPDRWVIATDDDGLTAKAAELGVETCSTAELQALIEADTGNKGQ
jgi:rRNA-processing protein FCF1